jgi:hypothetical protein
MTLFCNAQGVVQRIYSGQQKASKPEPSIRPSLGQDTAAFCRPCSWDAIDLEVLLSHFDERHAVLSASVPHPETRRVPCHADRMIRLVASGSLRRPLSEYSDTFKKLLRAQPEAASTR